MEIVIGAVIAAVAGLVAAWVTNRATVNAQRQEREAAAALERERWQREDALRRDDQDRRERERWLVDTREVCARLLRHVDIAARGAMGADPSVHEHQDLFREVGEAWQAVSEIELLAPDLADPAFAVCNAMWNMVHAVTGPGGSDDEAKATLISAFRDASKAFIAAAQLHLSAAALSGR